MKLKNMNRPFSVQKKKIPFCAGKSATPSHNVGLNIQGLMHQLKTKNQTRPRSATVTPTPSTASSTKLTDEIGELTIFRILIIFNHYTANNDQNLNFGLIYIQKSMLLNSLLSTSSSTFVLI